MTTERMLAAVLNQRLVSRHCELRSSAWTERKRLARSTSELSDAIATRLAELERSPVDELPLEWVWEQNGFRLVRGRRGHRTRRPERLRNAKDVAVLAVVLNLLSQRDPVVIGANHGGTWPKWSSLPPTPRLLDRIGVSPETDGSRLVRRGAAVARSRTALSRCGQRERRATLNAWATRSTRTPFVRTADVVSNPMPGTSSTPVSRWTSPHSASLTTSWMEREDSSIRSARRRTPDTRAVHGRTPERPARPTLSARCRRSTLCTSVGRLAAL
jgi:hypothetical protein